MRVKTENGNPSRTIPSAIVKDVRDLNAFGWSQKAIAEKHNINPKTVSDICRRKTYKDVP
jgi:DNA-binding NarL/FixJ family response regulator